jgi:hypothetical protein
LLSAISFSSKSSGSRQESYFLTGFSTRCLFCVEMGNRPKFHQLSDVEQ